MEINISDLFLVTARFSERFCLKLIENFFCPLVLPIVLLLLLNLIVVIITSAKLTAKGSDYCNNYQKKKDENEIDDLLSVNFLYKKHKTIWAWGLTRIFLLYYGLNVFLNEAVLG